MCCLNNEKVCLLRDVLVKNNFFLKIIKRHVCQRKCCLSNENVWFLNYVLFKKINVQ